MPDDKGPETAGKPSKGTTYADILRMKEAVETEKAAVNPEEVETAVDPGFTSVHRRIGPRRRRR